jgi:hypothetical protein
VTHHWGARTLSHILFASRSYHLEDLEGLPPKSGILVILDCFRYGGTDRSISSCLGEWVAQSLEFELQQTLRQPFCDILCGRICHPYVRRCTSLHSPIRCPLLRIYTGFYQNTQAYAGKDPLCNHQVPRHLGQRSNTSTWNCHTFGWLIKMG